MNNKRARRVGLGMKPRQGVEVQDVAVDAPPVAAETVSGDASAVGVQQEVPAEAVPEGVSGNSEGTPLDLSPVQNLELGPEELSEELQKEAIVAQSSGFEPKPEVESLISDLEKMLEESRKVTKAEQAQMISFEEASKMGLPLVEGADTYVIYRDGVRGMWKSDGKSVSKIGEELNLNPLGELPTGEYRATVRIAEGYTEGCRQQAESDEMSLEDWLTIQLNSFLEQWWFANGSK